MSKSTPDQYSASDAFTDSQLAEITLLKSQDNDWETISKKVNKKYKLSKSSEACRHAYRRYGSLFDMSNEEVQVKQLQEVSRVKRSNSKVAKENRVLLDYMNVKNEIMEELKGMISKVNTGKINILKPPKKDTKKKPMTLELLLSDLHYGKKTERFNLTVARARMQELGKVVLKEIDRCSVLYTVERVVIALLGDIIESSTMHGIESARGCEFGNAKQVQSSIESIFFDVILPIAKTGIVVDIPAVTGNHDRTEMSRTYHNPGEDNLTWIIYNGLKMMCEAYKLKNVTWDIPIGPYTMTQIYGNTVLYEHGDNAKGKTEAALEALLSKRQGQLKKIIDFFRLGHFHSRAEFGRGRIIINESLPGPDSFSDVLGFDSHSGQTLNYYVPTTQRPNCFYRSFPIYLK